jgi:hypothetical protein
MSPSESGAVTEPGALWPMLYMSTREELEQCQRELALAEMRIEDLKRELQTSIHLQGLLLDRGALVPVGDEGGDDVPS